MGKNRRITVRAEGAHHTVWCGQSGQAIQKVDHRRAPMRRADLRVSVRAKMLANMPRETMIEDEQRSRGATGWVRENMQEGETYNMADALEAITVFEVVVRMLEDERREEES